jgi:hypothetical protein
MDVQQSEIETSIPSIERVEKHKIEANVNIIKGICLISVSHNAEL